jgi:signal transduction histidine kinase
LASLTWYLLPEDKGHHYLFNSFATILEQILPITDSSEKSIQGALEKLSQAIPGRLTLRSDDGQLLGAIGKPLRPPRPGRQQSGWMRTRSRGPAWAIHLADGRWFMVKPNHTRGQRVGFLASLALLAGVLALGVYPLARGLTSRLERLQNQVDRLAAGDLSTRAQVEGRDEVAALASSFNQAAQQLERLVGSHKSLLASVSHELRTPLTRIRMGIELLDSDDRRDLCTRMAKDVSELDDLIGELLLASRLDTLERLEHSEELDLLALLAEEGAVFGAEVTGVSVLLRGDKRLLRRLIRNLLENSRRYGGEGAIEAQVSREADRVKLTISDQGKGVPDEEVEQIFEPFYRPISAQNSPHGGVGLGLSLVRQIAHHHGGEARYKKGTDGGASFEVTLGNLA